VVLRTGRPVFRSRPGRALLTSSVVVAGVTVALPYTPLAGPLALVPLTGSVLATLGLLTLAYAAANEITKRRFGTDATAPR
jgi:Mg2+-importing ATPase